MQYITGTFASVSPLPFFQNYMESSRAISGGALTRVTTFTSILQEVRESYGSSLSLGVLLLVCQHGEHIRMVLFTYVLYLHARMNMYIILWMYSYLRHMYITNIWTDYYTRTTQKHNFCAQPKTDDFQQCKESLLWMRHMSHQSLHSEAMLWEKTVQRFWPKHCTVARWRIYNCKVTWMRRHEYFGLSDFVEQWKRTTWKLVLFLWLKKGNEKLAYLVYLVGIFDS